MRIDNSGNRGNSNAYQNQNKAKKETAKENVKENSSDQNSDYFYLSSEIVLLNQLLNSPKHLYKPLPFYFSKSAMKNSLQVSNIATAIQQEAMSQDVNLNYDMILDLVLSHENEKANKKNSSSKPNINQTADYQHISLNENEMDFFEKLHINATKENISFDLVSIIVIEYFQTKQNKNLDISNFSEQTSFLAEVIKSSSNLDISSQKKQLLKILVTS